MSSAYRVSGNQWSPRLHHGDEIVCDGDPKDGDLAFVRCTVASLPCGIFRVRFPEKDIVALYDRQNERLHVLPRSWCEFEAIVAIRPAAEETWAERWWRYAHALLQVDRALAQPLDVFAVADTITALVQPLFRSDAAAFYLVERDTGDLVTISIHGWDKGHEVPKRIPAGTATVGLACRLKEPVTTSDVLNDPRLELDDETRACIERSGNRSILALPVAFAGQVIGALGIGHEVGREFSETEILIGQDFAYRAALAISHAELWSRAHGVMSANGVSGRT